MAISEQTKQAVLDMVSAALDQGELLLGCECKTDFPEPDEEAQTTGPAETGPGVVETGEDDDGDELGTRVANAPRTRIVVEIAGLTPRPG